MKKLYVCVFLIIVLVVVGCASQQLWRAEPNMQQASNEYYAATISPIFIFDGYKGFLLYIHNKSPEDLDVVWENTFYIYNGKKEGGFLLRGMRSGDKLDTPSIVSGSMFSKEIFPAKLAEFSTIAMSTIYNPMKPGENGILLTVKVGEKKIAETLTLNVSQE
jgi:hypothetical protein